MPRRLSTHVAVVLRLRPDVAERLRLAAARQNIELEAVAESVIESAYSKDGKATTTDTSKAPKSAADVRPAIRDPQTRREIDRLLQRAQEIR